MVLNIINLHHIAMDHDGEIHIEPANYSHKGTVTRKMFPFDDVVKVGFKCITDIHVLHIITLKANGVAWFRRVIEQTCDDILENIATCTSNCAPIFPSMY